MNSAKMNLPKLINYQWDKYFEWSQQSSIVSVSDAIHTLID